MNESEHLPLDASSEPNAFFFGKILTTRVFKKKRRKGYARSRGHRQKLTMLRVVRMDFDLDELVAMEKQQERLASVKQEAEEK